MLNVICKWVSKEFPDTSIEDFSVVALFISGMLGVICSVPFMSEIITGYDFNGLWQSTLAGFLSGVGVAAMFRAI